MRHTGFQKPGRPVAFRVCFYCLLIGTIGLGSCGTVRRLSPFRSEFKPNVVLTNQDHAPQMVILIKDLELPVTIHPVGAMPFTQNSYAALWVGRRFPYQKLAEILEFARHYYTDLHYVDVTADGNDLPDEEHFRIFIGGSTDAAIKRGLKPWTAADFDKLRLVKSQEEMIAFIEKMNGKR